MKLKSKKRLCIFYKKAADWWGKDINWIVCKECQKKLKKKHFFTAQIFRHKEENLLVKSYG